MEESGEDECPELVDYSSDEETYEQRRRKYAEESESEEEYEGIMKNVMRKVLEVEEQVRIEEEIDKNGDEEGTGVTRVVELKEVRENLAEWKAAMEAEVGSLEEKGAVVRLRGKEAKDYLYQHPNCQIYPGKGVFVIKRTGKYKVRVVVCGNYQQKDSAECTYSGTPDVTGIRTVLRAAGYMCDEGEGGDDGQEGESWCELEELEIGSVDVSTAFLNAPLDPETLKKGIAMRPPKVLADAGVAMGDEVWVIERALYGLRSAPRSWGQERDRVLREMRAGVNERFRLEELVTEKGIWKIIDVGRDGMRKTKGWAVTYVDDVLAVTKGPGAREILKRITEVWKCSEIEWLEEGREVAFVGVQIRRLSNGLGLFLHQTSYVKSVLKRNDMENCNPAKTTGECAEEEKIKKEEKDSSKEQVREDPNVKLVREAQRMVGELIWLVTRTRVDLAYTVHRAATMMLKEPERAIVMIKRLLRFIQGSQDHGLWYKSKRQVEEEKAEKRVSIPQYYEGHVDFSDMSFAPWGGASQACQITSLWAGPVQWRAQRQGIVALSTCEGELMAACEGFLMGRSNGELMKELFGGCGLSRELGPGLLLAVDNMAAVGILGNESSGNWRTRHLKVRSAAIHQALEEKVVKVAHCPGTEQIADIGTKTLPATTLNQLKALMGMESLSKLELLEKQKERTVVLKTLARFWVLKALSELGVEAKRTGKELVLRNEEEKGLTRVVPTEEVWKHVNPWLVQMGVVIGMVMTVIIIWEMIKCKCRRNRSEEEKKEDIKEKEVDQTEELEKEETKVVKVWVSSGGECFHWNENCQGLMRAAVRLKKKECLHCMKNRPAALKEKVE